MCLGPSEWQMGSGLGALRKTKSSAREIAESFPEGVWPGPGQREMVFPFLKKLYLEIISDL